MGRRAGLPKGHPMNALGMQVAFTLPLNFPLVAAAAMHHLTWFYPAIMIALGSHYLPFIFMYGMRQFGVLAGILITAGVLLGMYVPSSFSLGGWLTAVTLLVFAFLERRTALNETSRTRRLRSAMAARNGTGGEKHFRRSKAASSRRTPEGGRCF